MSEILLQKCGIVVRNFEKTDQQSFQNSPFIVDYPNRYSLFAYSPVRTENAGVCAVIVAASLGSAPWGLFHGYINSSRDAVYEMYNHFLEQLQVFSSDSEYLALLFGAIQYRADYSNSDRDRIKRDLIQRGGMQGKNIYSFWNENEDSCVDVLMDPKRKLVIKQDFSFN